MFQGLVFLVTQYKTIVVCPAEAWGAGGPGVDVDEDRRRISRWCDTDIATLGVGRDAG
jgi:hypothetical protein